MDTRRLLLSPLWLLVALAAMLGLNATSAAAGSAAETRVRAFEHVTVDAVGQQSSERPASVGCVQPETADLASGSCVATEAAPTLRGTNVAGEVTSRPGSFRQGTLQSAWDEAPVGANGGRVCTSCGAEMEVPPNSGIPRDWDASHNPSWSNREFPADVTRPQVLDNYNTGVGLECPGCNRSGGNRRW